MTPDTAPETLLALAPFIVAKRSAVIDPSGRYRYRLSREWDASKPRACFVMLNPSTADAERDDPTIRRCLALARDNGYGSLDVVNLFALRATYPGDLLTTPHDPIGPENDRYILDAARRAGCVIAAWGFRGGYRGRDRQVFSALRKPSSFVMCLGKTKEGYPRHPLYLRGDAMLRPYFPPSRGLVVTVEAA